MDPGFIHQGEREGNDITHGQTLTFKCVQPYTLVGSRQMTCVDGEWDSVLPECKGNCISIMGRLLCYLEGNKAGRIRS